MTSNGHRRLARLQSRLAALTAGGCPQCIGKMIVTILWPDDPSGAPEPCPACGTLPDVATIRWRVSGMANLRRRIRRLERVALTEPIPNAEQVDLWIRALNAGQRPHDLPTIEQVEAYVAAPGDEGGRVK